MKYQYFLLFFKCWLKWEHDKKFFRLKLLLLFVLEKINYRSFFRYNNILHKVEWVLILRLAINILIFDFWVFFCFLLLLFFTSTILYYHKIIFSRKSILHKWLLIFLKLLTSVMTGIFRISKIFSYFYFTIKNCCFQISFHFSKVIYKYSFWKICDK